VLWTRTASSITIVKRSRLTAPVTISADGEPAYARRDGYRCRAWH
jgi:hypothetical protein